MASLAGLVSKRTFTAIAYAPDEGAASAPSDFARRQLEKFGWKEGRGLGKDESGDAAFISVQRKDDNLGLGAKTAATVLRQTIERRSLDDDSDSDTDSDGESEEDADMKVFRACGGIRLGMRAQAPQSGKLARLAAADAAFAASMLAKAVPAGPAPAPAAAPAPAGRADKRKRGGGGGGDSAAAAAAAAKAAGKAERKAARKAARKAERKAAKKAAMAGT